MKLRKEKCLCIGVRRYAFLCVMLSIFKVTGVRAQAANGSAGITAATSSVAGYFDVGCNLMYAIGAVVGLIGAVKVYQKWSHGDHDTSKVASAWFGACIFLVVVAAILKGFFGVS